MLKAAYSDFSRLDVCLDLVAVEKHDYLQPSGTHVFVVLRMKRRFDWKEIVFEARHGI